MCVVSKNGQFPGLEYERARSLPQAVKVTRVGSTVTQPPVWRAWPLGASSLPPALPPSLDPHERSLQSQPLGHYYAHMIRAGMTLLLEGCRQDLD